MKQVDNCKFNVSGTPGGGTITQNAAETGHLTMAQAGLVDGDVVEFWVLDGTASGNEWGVVGGSATTLTRNFKSSTTGSLLSLTSAAIIAIVDGAQNNPDPLFASFMGAP